MLNLDSDSDEQQGENTATSSPALAKFLLKTDNTSNMNNYARIYLNYTSIDLEMMCSGHELRQPGEAIEECFSPVKEAAPQSPHKSPVGEPQQSYYIFDENKQPLYELCDINQTYPSVRTTKEKNQEFLKEMSLIDIVQFQKMHRLAPDHLNSIYDYEQNKWVPFYPPFKRKKLLIDPDKVLFDVITMQEYQKNIPDLLLKQKLKKTLIENGLYKVVKLERIERYERIVNEFVVALRPNAIKFLRNMRKYFDIYIFSQLCRELLFEIIDKVLDPDGDLIIKREFQVHREKSRVWTYFTDLNKNPDDLIQNLKQDMSQYNDGYKNVLGDFLIVDRSEKWWPEQYHNRILMVKTFAPLAGHVQTDTGIDEFPLKINIANADIRKQVKQLHKFFVIKDCEILMRDMTLNLIQTDLEKYFVQSLEQDVDIRKIRTDIIDKERNAFSNVGQKDEPGSPTLQQNVIKVMIILKDEGTGSFYNQIVSPILREIVQHRFKWQIYEIKYPTEKSQNGSFNSLNGTPRSKGGVLDTPKSSVFIFGGGAHNSNQQDSSNNCPYYIVTNYE